MSRHIVRVGMNFSPGSGYNYPFYNLLKTAPGLAGNTGSSGRLDARRMNVNGQGYPTNFSVANPPNGDSFTEIDTACMIGDQFIPTGTFVFLYDGGDGSTSFTCTTPGVTALDGTNGYNAGGGSQGAGGGRLRFDMPAHTGGFRIQLNTFGSPIPTNWRLVYSPDSTAGIGYGAVGVNGTGTNERAMNLGLYNGASIRQDFIDKLNTFKTLRSMQFTLAIEMQQRDFSALPDPDWWSWADPWYFAAGGGNGSPPPCAFVQMANALGANMWYNVAVCQTDACIASIVSAIHNGQTGALGNFYPGLNSNLKVHPETGNEEWNSALGHNQYQDADLGAPIYPTLANYYAFFSGKIDNGAGGAGNILTLIGSPTFGGGGSIPTGGDAMRNAQVTGTGITGNQVHLQALLSGDGQTAGSTFQVASGPQDGTVSLNTGTVTVSIGSRFSLHYQYFIRQAVRNWWTFYNGFTDKTRIIPTMCGQMGGQDYLLDALPNDQGSVETTWDGTHGGSVVSNMTAIAGSLATYAASFYTGPYYTPQAWGASGVDPGFARFNGEINLGNQLFQGAPIVATAPGGGALSNGWTTCEVTSGLSLPDPPPNGTVLYVNFSQLSGASPTMKVDGGTAYPIYADHIDVPDTIWERAGLNAAMTFTNANINGSHTACWAKIIPDFNSGGTINFFDSLLASTHASCQARGISFNFYEGGQQFYPGNGSTNTLWSQYYANWNQDISAYHHYYDYLLPKLESLGYAGTVLFIQYADVGGYGPDYGQNNGNFGAMQSFWQTADKNGGTPKMAAVVQWNLDGDTNLYQAMGQICL